MKFGIDRILEESALRKPLAGRRVALVGVLAAVAIVFLNSTQRFIYFKF